MKKLLVLFAIAALLVMSLTACDFSDSLDVLKEDFNKLKDAFGGMVEDLEGAVDIDVVPCPNHADNDSDHNCDLCLNPISECKDENKDHKCDICNKALSNCEDKNSDHKCDACSAVLTECDDRNNDHNCNLCGKILSVCTDTDKNHKCDVCAKVLSKCADDDADHMCDVCGEELSVCVDENDDNVCDICGKTICDHVDVDKNHECDLCDKVLSDHVDENNDHKCEYCGEIFSECSDIDSDHMCDVCGVCIHEYEENFFWHPELVAATCCEPGVAVFECMYCDDYYTEATDIDPEAHAFWGEEEIVTEANCVTKTNGLKKVHCANGCGGVEEVEIYYSEVHEWDVQKNTYATCTEGGEYYAVCTICGEVESYESPASGHYNWYFTCGDTCECMECGVEFTLEHDFTFSPATCMEPAYCMNCWSYVGEPVDHKDEDGDNACDFCGEALAPAVCEKHVDEDGDYNCDACGILAFEDVSYALNISDLTAGTLSQDLINGKFTIVSGSTIRNRTKTYDGIEYTQSVKIGDKTTMIKVSVPGTGKLTFLIQNGSSSAATQFVTVTGPDGTVYDVEFDGTNNGSPVVKIEIDVTEGEWTISRGKNGGTQDVFYLALDCKVEISPECGFEIVTEGKTDYLVGESIDLSGLVANAIFENGKTDPIDPSKLVIDTSSVDLTKGGVYNITVSYKEYDPITFQISVYEPSSIELGFDAISTGTQSGAGNGIYFNNSFKESYKLGEDLDLTGLSATVVATLGDSTLKFLVETVEVTGFDSETAGAKVLKVNYEYLEGKSVYAEVTVYVTDAAYSIVDEVYQVKVEKSYTGAIGAIVDGYNMFTTIQQALDFLAGAEANASKVLLIGEGLFEEKLEILIPNLTVKGAGKDKTTIEWNSIYGQLDASGFSNVTDSTQTVAVREAARGCVIEDITISNYWNSQDRMDAANLEIERGLALLVQADMFVMRDSKLLGIQDTLELFTGRQYFENVFISGYTDFIFGTNNTTYFKNCTIHVIDTTKDDNGTAGYLTAFKGSNKGEQDAITYGAIFDGCKFTADEGVTAGKTAIGRTWGAYAAVAVINSELGEHISKDGYDSANNKNKRYISMNGIHPTDETVQFVEYNNTGAGAITEAVAGMTMLTADEAAKYADFAVIFGTANGKVTYLDPWDPTAGEVAKDDRTYYYFNGVEGTSGTSYTYNDNIQGTVAEWEGLTIDTTAGKLTSRDADSQFNQGAKIIFNVEAGTLVTVISYPGYGYYTINGVAHNANDTFSMYFAEDSEVVIEATATAYLYQLIINPDEEAPTAPTINEIKVSGANANYTVGDDISLDSVVVKAYYSDSSVVTVTDYTVDTSDVNKAVAGEYDIVFTYGGKSYTVTVTYAGAGALVDMNVTFGSNGNYKDSGIDFSGANMRDNGGDNSQISSGSFSFEVKAGGTVNIHGYPGYTSYTIGDGTNTTDEITDEYYTYTATADVNITITAVNSNNYFYSIDVEYSGATEPEVNEWVLDATLDLEEMAAGSKTDGETETKGTDGFFTIHYSAKNKIDGSNKNFSDGYTATQRLNMGGKTEIKESGIKNAIEFTTNGPATVTIWWVCGDDGREIDLFGADGTVLKTTAEGCVKNSLYISTFEIAEAGKYFIGSSVGSNYYFKVEVKVAEPAEPETPDEPEAPKDFEVTFGSEGNYKDSGIDFSDITIADNGGNNSQVKEGSFSFEVKAGAVVTIKGYPGYTSYTLGDGATTTDEITADTYTYTATADVTITITPVNGGGNYFYSFSVKYPTEPETPDEPEAPKDFEVTFGSEGNYKDSGIDFSGITIADNGGNNSQVKEGSFSFEVKAGAVVTIKGYPGYTSYTLGDGATTTDEITADTYTYTATADVTITITPVNGGGNYFYSFSVKYPTEPETPDEPEVNEWVLDATLDLEEMAAGSKTDGETETKGTDGFFTIHYSAKNKIDGSNKNFSDGYTATQRLNMGGKTEIKESGIKNAIEFTTNGPTTVTIWWVCGDNGREIDLFGADGTVLKTTAEGCEKNSLYISTFEIAEAGKYFIGSSAGSNYYFKVEVVTG